MPSAVLSRPQKIVFAAGSSVTCADDFAQRQVRRVMLITSPSVAHHAKPVVEALMRQGILVTTISDRRGALELAQVQALLDAVRAFDPDGVIGLGGGATLDLAKLAASLHAVPLSLPHYFGSGLLSRRRTALACIPTTLGAGAEFSSDAFLRGEGGATHFITSPWLVPDAVYMDPFLTLTLPPAAMAFGGIVASARAIEALGNGEPAASPGCQARNVPSLIFDHLPAVLQDRLDSASRAQVVLGNLQACLCQGSPTHFTLQSLAQPLARYGGIPWMTAAAAVAVPLLRTVAELASVDDPTRAEAAGRIAKKAGILQQVVRHLAPLPNLEMTLPSNKLLAQEALGDPLLNKNRRLKLDGSAVEDIYAEAIASVTTPASQPHPTSRLVVAS